MKQMLSQNKSEEIKMQLHVFKRPVPQKDITGEIIHTKHRHTQFHKPNTAR